jgi:hypothetical protein
MVRARHWMRQQIATYGAAIAIILEQLDSSPRSTIPEDPNPLVRIRDEAAGETYWHPDELITRASGRQYVLIWGQSTAYDDGHSARISIN